MANLWRFETPCVIKPQQASLRDSYFVVIQLLLILMSNAGRLKDRKKNKQTDKLTKNSSFGLGNHGI